jgi:RHH-type rel operon transcriptional repressor/antitoxin RelB
MDIKKPNTEKPMTVRLPADLAGALDKLAKLTGRSKSNIAVAALQSYVESEASQIRDIEEGIAEADRGEFASVEEVNAFFARYGD